MPCREEAGVEPSEGPPRPNYITGQLLTADDLRLEQEYLIERDCLHTRLLHGWGKICGLEVSVSDHDPANLIVSPGIAVDASGREIIVPEPAIVNVAHHIASADAADATVEVILRYASRPAALVPHPNEQGNVIDRSEPSRIRDSFELTVRPFDAADSEEAIVLAEVTRSPEGVVSAMSSRDRPLMRIQHLVDIIGRLEERVAKLESRLTPPSGGTHDHQKWR